jgi:DNA-binding HxlR family transcriptional regulator
MHDKFDCPIMSTMAMISDKWKVLIICKLRNGKMRFNELMKALQGITQRVLTHQLRELESDGLVSRKVFPEVPPRVEYSLTHLGTTLVPALEQLENWAKEHSTEILNARRLAIKTISGDCTKELQVKPKQNAGKTN